ncbi:unnamed protein product [Choristocarpus tenellus]
MAVQGGSESNSGRWNVLIASLANLAISFNVVNISLVLKVMGHLYPESVADESLGSAGIVAGMMAGQVVFGAFGDYLGRKRALLYTLVVCIVGATGSALLTFDYKGSNTPDIFHQLILWRILLGVGVGGVYPLAATLARESKLEHMDLWYWLPAKCLMGYHGRTRLSEGMEVDDDEVNANSAVAVALVFSMQGIGYLCAHATGFLLLSLFPSHLDLAWRLLLGLGALPPLVVVVMLVSSARFDRQQGEEHNGRNGRYGPTHDSGSVLVWGSNEERWSSPRQPHPTMCEQSSIAGDGNSKVSRLCFALCNKSLLSMLMGTAGSWFLFDITFYGNALYQGDVLESAFGSREGLVDVAWQDLVLALAAVPGYFVAVAFIQTMGPRRMQVQGFLAMAVLFGVMGVAYQSLRHQAVPLMAIYSLTFFFSNFGPNSTTFMLPSLTFPEEFRGSLNGLSAAAGKFGALVGSLLFQPAAEAWGVAVVLLVCSILSLAGEIDIADGDARYTRPL